MSDETTTVPEVRDPAALRTYIEECQKGGHGDVMGFKVEALVEFLPWATAIEPPRLVKEAVEPWEDGDLTRDGVLKTMREYAEFGWGKIADEREISAGRTIQKMEAWLWLLGEDDLLAKVEAEPYGSYGNRQLAVVCEGLGFPIPEGAV